MIKNNDLIYNGDIVVDINYAIELLHNCCVSKMYHSWHSPSVTGQMDCDRRTAEIEVALEMAKGIRHISSASTGIGITGIAGPGGATGKKPVGLVYIAISSGKTNKAVKCFFKGSRSEIKLQAANFALDLLRKL